MRLIALSGIVSTTLVAACDLGIVDLRADPAPTRLTVSSSVAPTVEDPSLVEVALHATLYPGIGPDGVPRRMTSDILWVENVAHAPSPVDGPALGVNPGGAPRSSWVARDSFPTPGPGGIRLHLPQVAGLGPVQSVRMRVRVDATPGDTLQLAVGEDLVVGAEEPSNPAESFVWSLELTSPSEPDYGVLLEGSEAWPTELRVSADQIPDVVLPVDASLRIHWYRSLDLVALTPVERYELLLSSSMAVGWTVERGP